MKLSFIFYPLFSSIFRDPKFYFHFLSNSEFYHFINSLLDILIKYSQQWDIFSLFMLNIERNKNVSKKFYSVFSLGNVIILYKIVCYLGYLIFWVFFPNLHMLASRAILNIKFSMIQKLENTSKRIVKKLQKPKFNLWQLWQSINFPWILN